MEEPTEIFPRKKEKERGGGSESSFLCFFFFTNLNYPKQCAYEGKESINQVCVLCV